MASRARVKKTWTNLLFRVVCLISPRFLNVEWLLLNKYHHCSSILQ